jgi:hypothetical protein
MEKMANLETQVGQIHFNNKRLSKSFVSLFSEKMAESEAELYILWEVPVLNHAAWPEHEKMAALIESILKRNFKRPNPNSFENSIAQINDNLAKLAQEGHTSWVGKLNACLAVRQDHELYVATTGKIHAYLLRDGQLADIGDNDAKSTPLKAFTNFALGKVKKKDYIIFSTNQLFNYVSLERFKDLLLDMPLSAASHNIAEIIRELQDETISFGAIIVELGTNQDLIQNNITKFTEMMDQRSYKEKALAVLSQGKDLAADGLSVIKEIKLPKKESLKLESLNGWKNKLLEISHLRKRSNWSKLKDLPRAKKFFLATAVIFFLLLIINVTFASKNGQKKAELENYRNQYSQIEQKLIQTNTMLILNDQDKAIVAINEARAGLNSIPVKKELQEERQNIETQLVELERNVGKVVDAEVSTVLTLSDKEVDRIVQSDGNFYLFNRVIGKVYPLSGDRLGTETNTNLTDLKYVSADENGLAFTDKSNSLYSLEYGNPVPARESNLTSNNVGLVLYGNPTRAYTIDQQGGQVTYLTLGGSASFANYLKQTTDLGSALDLSIDGSVYVLHSNKIQKFLSGTEQAFANPGFSYSKQSRIYSDQTNIYVMDPDLKRILVFDKNGGLKAQLSSSNFTELRDMAPAGDGQRIYLLNGSSLLSVTVRN